MTHTLDKRQFFEHLGIRVVTTACITLLALALIPYRAGASKRGDFPIAGSREPVKTVWVVATAYSSDAAQTDDTPCIPANGYDLCDHYEKFGYGNTIAANFLPLETQIKLPEIFGDQVMVVRDRMNSRYGAGRIDVWMPTQEEARAFGVQYVEMQYYGGAGWTWRVASR